MIFDIEPQLLMKLDIEPHEMEYTLSILARFIPDREVRAFGSRVNDKATRFSDLDLIIMGEDRLLYDTIADIRDAFEESDLPFKVDILEWSAINDNFRQIIDQRYIVIQSGEVSGS
jgi:type I restriction enzyme S subunit